MLRTLGFGFWSFRLFFFFGGAFEVEGEEVFEDLVVGEIGRPAVGGGNGGGVNGVNANNSSIYCIVAAAGGNDTVNGTFTNCCSSSLPAGSGPGIYRRTSRPTSRIRLTRMEDLPSRMANPSANSFLHFSDERA